MDLKIQADGREFPHQEIRILDGIGLGDIVQLIEFDDDRLGIALVPTNLHQSPTLERFLVRPGEGPGAVVLDLLPPTGVISPIVLIDDPTIANSSDEIEFTETIENGDTVGFRRIDSNTMGIHKIGHLDVTDEKRYTVNYGRTSYVIHIRKVPQKRWWHFWK